MRTSKVLACVFCCLAGAAAVKQGEAQAAEPSTIEFAVSVPGARSLGFGGSFVALADDATAAYSNPAGLVKLVRSEISLELRNWDSDKSNSFGTISGFGFLSFVYPRDRWTFATYLHQVADLDFGWRAPTGAINPASGSTKLEASDLVLLTSLTVLNVGLSAAVAVNDEVSLGFGMTKTVGTIDEWGLPTMTGDGVFEATDVEDRTSEFGLVAGVNWTVAPEWVVGASYRSGVELVFDDVVDGGSSSVGGVSFPDVLAVGVAYQQLDGRLITTFEWDRLVSGTIEDRSQLRVGAEYVFLESKPVVGVRFGLWRDEGISRSQARLTSGLIPIGGREMHFSLGCGVAFRKFQLDLAVDLSDAVDTGSLSMIYSF